MTQTLLVETPKGISVAWGLALSELMEPGGGRHPALVRAHDLEHLADPEIKPVRNRLDAELEARGKIKCATVANTIFPRPFWRPGEVGNDQILYDRYERAWPGIARCRLNRKGVYFRRLTSYKLAGENSEPVNQLKLIIDTYAKGNHRKSALQASISDPTRDHTDEPYGSFPCLQHVTFTPLPRGRLSVIGFYARQLHLEKAYGNYLGLYHLGMFMAEHMKLKLSEVNCIASFLDLAEGGSKVSLQALTNDVKALIL